ncbi:MFS general substrate transporter [Colletotrichum scovillei]|uniref:MFS general substrate transporter n=1 Tax=Colletotrichum scovillei TaxID=1209932 RepID=A0A9P7QQU9_9PEZI|nr:MFS general substrate transporter [Colletotrichum scovillei]KAG7040559.1 MFS general substrate transporter [Colletotrichum scovillei]KAG7060607.1 MFS general substrate transporter [Colletotrichum scovillei]
MAPSKPAPNSEILENLTLSQSPTKPRKTTSRQDEDQEKDVHIATEASTSYRKDIRFWAILFALCITSLLASLETTVVVTSLPTIVERLKFGSSYVWVGNIFFLTSAAVQPLFGQFSNLFGRRNLTLFIVAIYTLGSGICGGANSPTMLIAGRAVQGMGSGGVNMIIDIIISDLVPLRDRGNYIAIILAIYGVGMAVGPFVGGIIVQTTSWRWVFYINLPVGGLSLVLLYLFLHVKWDRTVTFNDKLRRIDYIGNSILIASTVSILIALTWAGAIHPWSSYRVIVPLILGLVGLIAFCIFEGSGTVPEPVMPLRLFANRTSAVVYATTFLNSAILYWAFFFLPLYFQAVKLSTPARSGVQLLPVTLISIPGAAISAVVLARWGRYKALHIVGFALMTLGLGIWAVLDRNSSTVAWVLIQVVPAVGSGMLLNTLLPAFQAGLAEADQAAATASWSFIRSFGSIWGVAIPAAIFNTYTSSYAAQKIDDPAVRSILQHGDAYASATKAFVESFAEPTRSQIIDVFTEAMRKVFLIAIAFGGLAFLLSFLEREVELRKELETEFGLEEKKNADGNKDAV